MRKIIIGCWLAFATLGLSAAADKAPEELNWDHLIPADFDPSKLFEKYNLESIDDADPRASEILREMKEAWKAAPIVESLAGRYIKLPGFVVPLETEQDKVTEFFLVPYYGACIHVPPPPANQMVHVVMPAGQGFQGNMYDPVWVIGNLTIQRTSNELGDAGYRLSATRVEPYK